MAKIYRPPKGFDKVPELSWDNAKDWMRREHEYIDKLAAELRKHDSDPLVGEVLRFPMADSHALYMVGRVKPLALVHLPLGDAWRLQDFAERGLRLADVRRQVDGEKRLKSLFKGAV